MKKITLTILLLAFSMPAFATTTQTPSQVLGVDLSQPYLLLVNGNGENTRANMNLGMNYRYFTNDNLSFGLRYALDIEKQALTARAMSVAPGLQVQWFQGQNWMPYFRADVPYLMHGAPNATLDSGQQDVGVDVGTGLAWNLGNQIGINNLLFRYDFTFSYFFGLGGAFTQLSLEFFKFGMEYRF